MALILDGTNGLSDVDGSAATPAIRGSDANTGIFFPAADTIAFAEGGAEAMRLNSAGSLCVGSVHSGDAGTVTVSIGNPGTTSGGLQLWAGSAQEHYIQWGDSTSGTDTYRGAISYTHASDAMKFWTGSTERARITSTGLFRNHSSEGVFRVNTSQGAGTTYELFWGGFGGSSTTAEGTNSIKIYTNGNIQNTNNSYGSLSDAKLKENVTDATPKLDKLNQVRVVNYNLKGESGHETHKQIGVIAQELEQIFPGMVEESPDRDAEGNDLGTTTKAVKYSVFVPMLIKAIQEQQALISSQSEIISAQQTALTALTARVEAQEVRLTSLEGAQA